MSEPNADPPTDPPADPQPLLKSHQAPEWDFHQAVAPDGTLETGWHDHLPEDVQFDGLKDLKNLPDLVKSYRGALDVAGRKGEGVTIPTDKSSDEVRQAFRRAMGVPDAPDGYGLERPEDIPEDKWNQEEADKYSALFHKHNVTPAFVQELFAQEKEIRLANMEAEKQLYAQDQESVESELRESWGVGFDRNMMLAKRAIASMADHGVSMDDPDMSRPGPLRLAAALAEHVNEKRLVSSDVAEGRMSPGNQLAGLEDEISEQGNKHPVMDPSHPNHAAALSEYNRLNAEDYASKQRAG